MGSGIVRLYNKQRWCQQIANVISIPGNRSNAVFRNTDREYAECFFARNEPEEEEEEGIADDIYYIESVKEGNQEQYSNAFEIFDNENIEDDM